MRDRRTPWAGQMHTHACMLGVPVRGPIGPCMLFHTMRVLPSCVSLAHAHVPCWGGLPIVLDCTPPPPDPVDRLSSPLPVVLVKVWVACVQRFFILVSVYLLGEHRHQHEQCRGDQPAAPPTDP